ncbi:Pex12 amino terminal region-domain-containing protein [Zopfochytrium polystomum]|nr:Pex12 amino terminal region-domain-containing protein [Zopfochytrium polystomum]
MEFLSDAATSADPFRPSVFELVAQEKMRDMLKPALRFVLAVYAQRYPRYLIPLVNNHEHVFAAIMAIVERHYLVEWGSSFAENFYGLKRVPAVKAKPRGAQSTKLSSRQVWGSIVFLVGVPYMKALLDETYEKLGGRHSGPTVPLSDDEDEVSLESASESNVRKKFVKQLKRLFLRLYPYLHAAYHISILVNQLAYMYEKTEFCSPWLRLLGLKIRRMSAKDYKEHQERNASNSIAKLFTSLSTATPVEFIFKLAQIVSSGSLEFLKTALPMSVFFFRFLEWWYASEYHKQAGVQPIPPPPPLVQPHPDGLPVLDDDMCSICQKERTNATLIPSGYVFCYPCIFREVEATGRCPITFMETTIEQLRRLYATG